MKTKVAQLMKLGYSVSDIARMAQLSRPTVYKIMGEMPWHIRTIYKLKRGR